MEAEGKCTGDVGQRAELSNNVWTIATARDPNADERKFTEMTPAVLIDAVKQAILAQDGGVEALVAALSAIDDRGNGIVDRQEFAWALRDFGVTLDEIQSQILLNHFDTNKDGAITVAEFLAHMQ